MYLAVGSLFRVSIQFCSPSIFDLLILARYAGDIYGQPGESSKTVTVGLCTGLLAAAAVASSPALPALVPLAVEIVLIAFRTGLCVGTAARSLELSQDRAASWSTIVTGTDDKEAKAVIDSFHTEKVRIRCFLVALAIDLLARKSPNRSKRISVL